MAIPWRAVGKFLLNLLGLVALIAGTTVVCYWVMAHLLGTVVLLFGG